MRIGVIPENPIERAVMAVGMVPTPFMTGVWGMFSGRILFVATRLGVFEELSKGEKTCAEVAQALGASPTGMEALLKALNGFGLVSRSAGSYSLNRQSRRWLIKDSKWSMRDAVLFMELLWDWMGDLEAAVIRGEPERLHDGRLTPEMWELYMRGLASFARPASKEITRRVKLGNPKRLLDIGGGHGEYSVGFCRKHPELEAEVMDLPGACEHGRRIVAEAGFSERVRHREGDMRTDEWTESNDAVLIFNVIHNASPEEARSIVGRAFKALRPGGTLAILEGENRSGAGNLSNTAGFGELFFFLVSGARTYPEATIRQWMADAGFGGLKTSRLLMAPVVLVTGQRP